MKFEWDSDKNLFNMLKHKISFKEAALVFLDVDRMEFYDEEHSIFEDRYVTIGRVEEVIVVVYTERKDVTRIISARKASREEEEAYYDGKL